MPKPKPIAPPEVIASPDYERVGQLLSMLGKVQLQLAARQVEINESAADLVEGFVKEVVTLQGQEQALNTQLEAIAKAHPDWFATAKSVKTLTGVIKFHASTELVADDEELTMSLLKREEEKALKDHRVFFADDYIRTTPELNLDALGTLDDATLERLKVRRVPKENFSAAPATIDLGKSCAALAEQEAATSSPGRQPVKKEAA